MKILGVETSCDETALALIDFDPKTEEFEVIQNLIHSQIDLHREFGGVYPALAKREHIKNLPVLLDTLTKQTKIDKAEAVAVTEGPGLEIALWTGIDFANSLSTKWNVPLIPVNHMEGHIIGSLIPLSATIKNKENNNIETETHKGEIIKGKKFKLSPLGYPAISLLISGGHTELVLIKSQGKYEIIGKTRDDAVGEAFDKVARLLSLPYPGGPEISKMSKERKKEKGNIDPKYPLPRPMLHSKDFDFSFSGIKTHVLYTIKKIEKMTPEIKKEIAYEFERAVTEVLIHKTREAIAKYMVKDLIIGGGVVANEFIRENFARLTKENNIDLHLPPKALSGDNALMIAIAGATKMNRGLQNPHNDESEKTKVTAKGNLKLA